VLRFDSPGGDVSGCFDAALSVRAACDAAGKQLHAYVEGECASAAYAFASQCQSITISMTSLVGSVGVLSTREDVSAMNASRGIRIALVMSGARKGDGHPEAPISDAELANMQGIVDSMASVFFDLVARGRGMSAEAIAQLQARVFHGDTAVRAGLADAVGSLTTVLATVAGLNGGTNTMDLSAKAKSKMSYEEMRAMLAAAAEGDDPNAAAAKKALAAMDEHKAGDPEKKDEKSAEGGGDAPADPPAEKKDPPADDSAEGGSDDKTAEGATGATAAMRLALKASRETAELRAELTKRDEAVERTKLIASRPDLTEDVASLLEKAPMDLVREHIKAMPALKVAAASGGNPRILKAGRPVVGKGQEGGESHLPTSEKSALDQRMGIGTTTAQVVSSDYKLELGAFKAS
jgi:ClpP class serine protease